MQIPRFNAKSKGDADPDEEGSGAKFRPILERTSTDFARFPKISTDFARFPGRMGFALKMMGCTKTNGFFAGSIVSTRSAAAGYQVRFQ